jgi:hypothetical protein
LIESSPRPLDPSSSQLELTSMIRTTWRTFVIASIRLAVITAAIAPWVLPGRAEAQYGGFGGFGGFGWGGFNPNAYAAENYLNQRSLINATAAANSRPQTLTTPAYQSRDDSFYDKYDLATREAMIDRVARHPGREMGTADPAGMVRRPAASSTPTVKAAPSIPPPPAEVHLAGYFNKDHQLVWPSVSPISGDLGKKQTTADLAILAVLNEYDMKGLAQLSTVTNARQKLLDYGRPALQYVREQSTPAIADSFHVFLLALYNNVGNAATVPKLRTP